MKFHRNMKLKKVMNPFAFSYLKFETIMLTKGHVIPKIVYEILKSLNLSDFKNNLDIFAICLDPLRFSRFGKIFEDLARI